jgi:hypothetical protein
VAKKRVIWEEPSTWAIVFGFIVMLVILLGIKTHMIDNFASWLFADRRIPTVDRLVKGVDYFLNP